MVKKVQYTYKGLNQDVTKSKHPFQFYYNAKNIRIVTTDTQSTGSVSNEKGQEQIIDLPTLCIDVVNKVINYGGKSLPFDNQEIIDQINDVPSPGCEDSSVLPVCSEDQLILGYALTRNSIVLFSTDTKGFDCIWEVKEILNDNYDLELLYCRNLGFSINNPIQALFNYENEVIQKVYWVDGKNQLRFLNIRQSIENGDLENLIDLRSSTINITGDYALSQPTIFQITQGGGHTAGMIQYAYNLYKLNGSQTTISPVSEIVPLDFGTPGGGEVNEIVGAAPTVKITNIDENYTNIRIYAIKYTALNEVPSIGLIYDQEIDNYEEVLYFDNASVINTISLEEFLFLGSNVFIPQHIQTKDSRLFAANLTDKAFDLEIDCRSYSFNSSGQSTVRDADGALFPIEPLNNYNLPPKNAAINDNYNVFIYQSDGSTLGGEGRYIKYEILQKAVAQCKDGEKNTRVFKDREIYRIGIEFYNGLGQKTAVKWMADLKAPTGNLEDRLNTLNVTLKPEFFTYINSLCLNDESKPVGYKVVRADREANDRTILCQGAMTSMICQTVDDPSNFNKWKNIENRREESKKVVKKPIITSRDLNNSGILSEMNHLLHMNENPNVSDDSQEIFRESATDFKRQQTWQFNQMFQLYSPEVLFSTGLTFTPGLKFRVNGIANKSQINLWTKGILTRDESVYREEKFPNRIQFSRGDGLGQYGWIGPGRDEDGPTRMNFKQLYHQCETFTPASSSIGYSIYGSPEITERGQGITNYFNDTEYQYSNSLESFLTDAKKWTGDSDKNEPPIETINSWGAKCLTIVEGSDTDAFEDRQTLEKIWNDSQTGVLRGLVIAEVTYPDDYVYNSNIYGGNSFEAKSRTNYIQIGEYQTLDNPTVQIDSPGDTYVQIFRVARLAKTDTKVISDRAYQLTDTLSFKVETTVNLLNRQDLSLKSWETKNQYRYDEYHKYNNIYSQQSTLIQNQALDFKFKKVDAFDTRVIASKSKIPGEVIDSFTDFLDNEIIDLDGKYGAINNIVNFKDELFAMQDTGISKLIINPRVQVQGNDGLSLELGRGAVLYDYQYLTTTSGTLNKWAVVVSPTGFYYLDLINKTWNKSNGGSILELSDTAGLHAFFNNNLNFNELSINNPLLKTGASAGYDLLNNTAYLTLLQKDNNQTINFNEMSNSFESFHDYHPSIYMNKGHKLYSTAPNLNEVWEHDKGPYQTFYGEYFPSFITLQVNPESNLDCVFNNIEYKSEMYLDDVDQPEATLSHITAWNEYQRTNRLPLVLGRNKNLRRKFRNWQAQIPRQAGSRDRIRNPWIFLKLELDRKDNLKMILHDIIIHYSI